MGVPLVPLAIRRLYFSFSKVSRSTRASDRKFFFYWSFILVVTI